PATIRLIIQSLLAGKKRFLSRQDIFRNDPQTSDYRQRSPPSQGARTLGPVCGRGCSKRRGSAPFATGDPGGAHHGGVRLESPRAVLAEQSPRTGRLDRRGGPSRI